MLGPSRRATERLPPPARIALAIHVCACCVSTRYEYVFESQVVPPPNELTARIVFVPATRSGPPESPWQTPTLFACNFRNSLEITLLLANTFACPP